MTLIHVDLLRTKIILTSDEKGGGEEGLYIYIFSSEQAGNLAPFQDILLSLKISLLYFLLSVTCAPKASPCFLFHISRRSIIHWSLIYSNNTPTLC